MGKVIRSAGLTESERYLARLADRTFLNLWAYPNLYRDTVVNGRKAGKELCDLLVVCGDHVIIFSDKHVKWPNVTDVNTAWIRWYKRAIEKSVHQIRGAERWLAESPNRLFLDQSCTQPLPILMPPPERRIVTGIVVATGAAEACSHYFNGDSGSFMLRPNLEGEPHFSASAEGYSPFVIGDVDPKGPFIHVFNDVTLDAVMKELDTVTDFTNYLERKAAFVRSGKLLVAAGEEELLAHYVTHMVDGHHDFAIPRNQHRSPDDRVILDQGSYAEMVKNEQYRRKKEADRSSYLWDRLIEVFTKNMLAGTTIVPDGSPFVLADHEITVRYMAQEPRVVRRMLSNAISGLLSVAHKHHRAFRAVAPPPEKPGAGTGYAFMTLAYPDFKLEGGYEQYRKTRIAMLQAYCMTIAITNHQLKRIIGIAMEPPQKELPGAKFSEDMLMLEPPHPMTPEFEREQQRLAKVFDVMRKDRVRATAFHADEYPTSPEDPQFAFARSGHDAIRQAERKISRNDPCPCGSGKKYKRCCLR